MKTQLIYRMFGSDKFLVARGSPTANLWRKPTAYKRHYERYCHPPTNAMLTMVWSLELILSPSSQSDGR